MIKRIFKGYLVLLCVLSFSYDGKASQIEQVNEALKAFSQTAYMSDLHKIVTNAERLDVAQRGNLRLDILNKSTDLVFRRVPTHICLTETKYFDPWIFSYELAIKYIHFLKPVLTESQKEKLSVLCTLHYANSDREPHTLRMLNQLEEFYKISYEQHTQQDLLKKIHFGDILLSPYCIAYKSLNELTLDRRVQYFTGIMSMLVFLYHMS